MVKEKITYQCSECNYIAPSYLGKCPECSSWGTMIELRDKREEPAKIKSAELQRRVELVGELGHLEARQNKPVRLAEVSGEQSQRYSSGFAELDRVLGGGILPGSYVLIGGDPGIGKSTLMLQTAERIARQGKPMLYIAGEESPYQIKMRAERLGLDTSVIEVLAETNIHKAIEAICTVRPELVIIDSIQSVYHTEVSGTPGSVSQIKACAGLLMEVAKSLNVTVFLVGHVTKEGAVSGPKLLEHTVDAVLYFEGDKYKNLRLLRTVKNRFGSTQEIGVFEMIDAGLREVDNPSELFLSNSSYQSSPGSVIVCTLEGTRPILVELQALTGQSAYSTPRRVANGVEYNRLHQIVAVLERRLGLDFSHQDIYVNVVGGMRIDEPAADLGIALAIISSHRNLSLRTHTVVAGEIGLTGEIRPVRQWQSRLQEAGRIGFERIVLPRIDAQSGTPSGIIEVLEVSTLSQAIQACFAPQAPAPSSALTEETLVP